MSGLKVEKGSFILVNYTAWVLNGEEKVIDTTIEEVARENNIFRENIVYEPELVIVGEGFILKPVEEALIGLEEGAEKEIILEPEQAFGVKDPKNIKVLSARELTRRGIIPRPGEEVEIGGKRGRIIRVGGGRVTIDFNHPYAGRKVKFNVKIEKILTEDSEKIKELFHRWFRGISRNDIEVTLKNNEVVLNLPPSILQYEGAYILANGFIRDVEKYFKDIKKVSLIENFIIERPSETEKSDQTPSEAQSEAQTEEKSDTKAPEKEVQESQPQQQ